VILYRKYTGKRGNGFTARGHGHLLLVAGTVAEDRRNVGAAGTEQAAARVAGNEPGGAGVRAGAGLGFGRIVASEIEAPNMLAILVWSRCAAVQSDNATEPCAGLHELSLACTDHVGGQRAGAGLRLLRLVASPAGRARGHA
jgi:hypothetical protein